ncbi:MAG: hypothetical protein CM1200mP9_04260 [Gammaproteobacteria bacterium]|nr:MAG: hypothetical protein CM1200mP9_04260 [Gammaproteobacteria bacterium]
MGIELSGPRVVDKCVDSSPFFESCIGQCTALVIVSNVGFLNNRFNALFFASYLRCTGPFFVMRIINDNVTAFLSELPCTCRPHARGRTCHNRHPILYIHETTS